MKCCDCGNDFHNDLEENRCKKCWERYWKNQADYDENIGKQANLIRYP